MGANMDRFGLLSHHHHHKSQGQGGGKEESTVLVLDPSIAFLYCFFLLAIVMAAICFNFRRRSQAVRVDLRLVQEQPVRPPPSYMKLFFEEPPPKYEEIQQ